MRRTRTGPGRKAGTSAAEGIIKAQLLAATRELLSNAGRDGATIRAICSHVGVTPPTLYHHYGDLQQLHKAAINESYRAVAEAYRHGQEQAGAVKGIRDGWETFMAFAAAEPNMCRLVIQQIMEGDPPEMVRGTLQKLAQDLAGDYRSALQFPVEATAELLWMAALGALTYTVSAPRSQQDTSLQHTLLDVLLPALLKQPEGDA